MYTKQEASLIRQRFWISFGRYMAPVPSSTGEKVNWINYRTGIKFIQFKMDAIAGEAYIGIEISHPAEQEREMFFNHFKTFKKTLENDFLLEKWEWQAEYINATGNRIAHIYKTIQPANIYEEAEWPKLISFLKDRIIALDRFWNEYREIFEMLH